MKVPTEYTEGRRYVGTSPRSVVGLQGAATNQRKEDEGYGAVRAIDPKTGEQKWEFKMLDVTDAGVLTTASDLVVFGRARGIFLCAGCSQRRVVVEGQRGRRRDLRSDILFGEWKAVYLGDGREFVAGVRAEAVRNRPYSSGSNASRTLPGMPPLRA